MNLKDRIDSDFKNFFKERNELGVATLRLIKSALHNEEIALRKKDLTDDEINKVLAREAKKRKESVVAFEKGGRDDLAEKEKKELGILNSYLPEQLSEAEIKKVVQSIVDKKQGGNLVFGQIMGEVMKELKGKADGQLVNQIVRETIDSAKED